MVSFKVPGISALSRRVSGNSIKSRWELNNFKSPNTGCRGKVLSHNDVVVRGWSESKKKKKRINLDVFANFVLLHNQRGKQAGQSQSKDRSRRRVLCSVWMTETTNKIKCLLTSKQSMSIYQSINQSMTPKGASKHCTIKKRTYWSLLSSMKWQWPENNSVLFNSRKKPGADPDSEGPTCALTDWVEKKKKDVDRNQDTKGSWDRLADGIYNLYIEYIFIFIDVCVIV